MIDRIEKVGVLGAGLMGHGIAQLAAQAGCEVVLIDISEQELQKGLAKIQKLWSKDVEKGRLTREQADALPGRIKTSMDLHAFADCDVVIEAIPEIMELKKETFARLDRIVKPDAILATNTSQLSITEIATATNRTDKVIGMHFFYPAQVMRLIEIPVGEHTSQQCIDLIVDLSRRMKKETCVCRDTPGFIVNRILAGMEVGLLYSRGLGGLRGYWNDQAATEEAFLDHEWATVGDLAVQDEEGYYYIVDRVKDMIITGGVNVYPVEIEATLRHLDKIQDVAVIGVPDEKWGESVKAVVVAKPGTDLTEEEIINFAKEKMAGFKVPKSVDFVAEIPRSLTGKILKKDLRAKYWGDSRFQIS